MEGEAADQRSTSEFLFGEDAGECIGSESYIGIEKEASHKSAVMVLAVSIPLTLILWGVLL